MRIRRLPFYLKKELNITVDSELEREVDRELNVESHGETTRKIDQMSDKEFFELLQRVIRRRKAVSKYVEEQRREEFVYLT